MADGKFAIVLVIMKELETLALKFSDNKHKIKMSTLTSTARVLAQQIWMAFLEPKNTAAAALQSTQ